MDRPSYRGPWIPTIASGVGLFPPEVVIFTLPLVDMLAVGADSLASSRLPQVLGGSTSLGLAFCLNLGLVSEVDISGEGAVALAFGAWGVVAAEQARMWLAALAPTGAALSRETVLVSVVVLAWILWHARIHLCNWKEFHASRSRDAGVDPWPAGAHHRCPGVP